MSIDAWMSRNVPSVDYVDAKDTLVGIALLVAILAWFFGLGAFGCWLGLIVGMDALGVVYSGLLYVVVSGVVVRLFCYMMTGGG